MTHLEKLIELAEAHDAKKAEAFGEVVKEWTMEDIFPDDNNEEGNE